MSSSCVRTVRLLKLLVASLLLAVLACFLTPLALLWQVSGGLLLAVMLLDFLTLPGKGRISGERSRAPGRFALGVSLR
ncbi:MAG: hypothetical protein R3F13_03775 [Prosthecobacter sp.]